MISICIPTRDRPGMLFQALCSILAQGEDDIELVLKDNGDVPVMKDERCAGALELFGLHLNYRAGAPLSLFRSANDCLERARGDVLYLMGDDDLLSPGALRTVREIFERERRERFGGRLWLYGKTVSADESGRTWGIDGEVTTFEKLLEHNRIGLPSVFWTRRLMNLTGPFDIRYRHCADYDLYLRFWRHSEPAFVDAPLGIYRHHSAQASRVHAQELEREAQIVSMRHRSFGAIISGAHAAMQARRFGLVAGRE